MTDRDLSLCRVTDALAMVEIEGSTYTFSKTWVDLTTHYEVELPFSEMMKISYVPCDAKVLNIKCGALMRFTSPISFGGGYYLIPGFTAFAISRDGRVLSARTKRRLKESVGPYGYPYVNLYDPDKKKWRSVGVHLLLARTFIPNFNPSVKPFVNHKDGNKLNYALRNLEWVSTRENVDHAIASGLRTDNRPCKVRNVVTGTVTTHASVGKALQAIGIKAKSARLSRNLNGVIVPHLFKDLYEIKLLDDESPWYHKQVRSTKKDKSIGPFQAYEIRTGKIFVCDTMTELAKATGVKKHNIWNRVADNNPRSSNGFIFRKFSEDPWPDNAPVTIFYPKRNILAINVETNQKLTFASLRQTCQYFNLDKATVKNRLATGKSISSWAFEEINGESN